MEGDGRRDIDDLVTGFPHHPGKIDVIAIHKESLLIKAADFLKQLTGQKVFLFGTAGFGGSEAYFAQIMERVKGNLAPGVQVLGTYMCQGKMPQAVRTRYEQMPESPRRAMMLANFDQAVSHPDTADLARLKEAVAG